MIHHRLGRHHFGIREGFHQRLKAEVEIRIAGGNHNLAEGFTAATHFLDQLLAIFDAELRIEQHGLFRPGNQRG
ncbi:hypothetical protein D3C71_2019080 [compost metagenome]